MFCDTDHNHLTVACNCLYAGQKGGRSTDCLYGRVKTVPVCDRLNKFFQFFRTVIDKSTIKAKILNCFLYLFLSDIRDVSFRPVALCRYTCEDSDCSCTKDQYLIIRF